MVALVACGNYTTCNLIHLNAAGLYTATDMLLYGLGFLMVYQILHIILRRIGRG